MELEHLFTQSNLFSMMQFVFISSLAVPALTGRFEMYRSFINSLATNVVSFGPFALLGYVLYQVSRLA